MILNSVSFGSGSATPLVLLGSLGSSAEMWLPQLDYFAASRRVIALDHRGHGASTIEGPALIDDLASDVLSTLDSLGVTTFDVIGLSLGGAVAQHLALNSGRVRKLVLTSTAAVFGTPESWTEKAAIARSGGLDELSHTVISRWFSPTWIAAHPASLEHWRRMISATPAEGYAVACGALSSFDSTSWLSSIEVPTLVVAGTEDGSTAPEVVRFLADSIPDAEYHEFSPAAHLLNVERAEDYNRLVEEFLA
ncbi:3-oxoadipate enol-lactonase [Corynebacterium kalinowskii]|nr:3-oxoadipate enol-lactonase [Corynebacterium kalinowskii]